MTAQTLLERQTVLPKIFAALYHNKYLVTGIAAAATGLAFGSIPIMIGAGALGLGAVATYMTERTPSLLKLGAAVAVAACVGFGGWQQAQQVLQQNEALAHQAQNEIAHQFSAGTQNEPLAVAYDRQSLWTGRVDPNGGLVMARNPTFSSENLEMEVSIDGKPYIPVAYLIGARGTSPLSLSI